VIALFTRGLGRKLRGNRFIWYSVLIFLVNFPVYWISPEVYPRYLFMFLPLMFSLFFYMYMEHLPSTSWQYKFIYTFTLGLCGLLLIGILIVPFTGLIDISQLKYVILLALLFSYLFWMTWRHKDLYLFTLLLTVLVFRVGFGWFVMPERAKKHITYRERAAKIAAITKGSPLHILRGSDIGNFDGMSFHIAAMRGELLGYRKNIDSTGFYIADGAQLKGKTYVRYYSFPNFYAPDSLRLVRFLSLQP
jgi:hypothetical protein